MPKRYPVYFLLSLLLLAISSYAQVDLSTGKASVNFPLFEYSDGERLNCNVMLNYTGGSGIKVNEIPTCVGLGWELTTGGTIVRTTNNEPDDQVGGVYGGDRYGDGFLYSPYNLLSPLSKKGGWVPLYQYDVDYYRPDSTVLADREQDVFTFRFGGRTGSFVISKEGYIRPLDNSRIKIEKIEQDMTSQNIITRIGGFIITDEYGVKYTFKAFESSRIISYTKGGQALAYGQYPVIYQKHKINPYSVINNWHLSEITDPFSGKKIVFNYVDYNLEYLVGYDGVYTTSQYDDKQDRIAQTIEQWYSGTRKRITGISFSGSKTAVAFKYFENDLVDLPGERALKQIAVIRDGIEVSGYQFNFQYFSKDLFRAFDYVFPATEQPYARLCLQSFQKTGLHGIAEPACKFSYFNKTPYTIPPSMPPRTSSPDHWGYFNGRIPFKDYASADNTFDNVKYLCTANPYRNVSSEITVRLGMLKEVEYPTGGKLMYEYENNTASSGTSTIITGGVRVASIAQYDMVDTLKKQITTYRYIKEDGTSSGWGYETPQYLDTLVNVLVTPPSSTPFRAANMAYSIGLSSAPLLIKAYANSIAFSQISGQLSFNIFATLAITFITSIFTPPPSIKVLGITNWQSFSTHPAKSNPLPQLYERVEVISGTTASNIGKTVYEFTSPKDFPLKVASYQAPFAALPRCLPWVYGLLKRKVELGKNNNPVTETLNSYRANIAEVTLEGHASMKWKARQVLLCPEPLYNTYANSSVILQSVSYYPLEGKAELLSVTDRRYDSLGKVTQSVSNYVNDPVYYYPTKVTSLNSTGDTIQERFYYVGDYSPDILSAKVLKDANAFNTLVSKERWQLRSNGQYLVDAAVMDFKPQLSGEIKVEQRQTLQTAVSLPFAKAGNFNPLVLNRLPAYLRKEEGYNYDNTGKLVHLSSPDAPETGYQWGYNKEQVVAVVKNAHAAYTGKTGAAMGATGNGMITSTGNENKTATITLSQTGTIYLKLDALSGQSRYCSYTLSGGVPNVAKSGYLANVQTPGKMHENWNDWKTAYPASIAFGNLPAGAYTLTVHNFIWFPLGSTDPSTNFLYSYNTEPAVNIAAEFYYEGFEDSTNAALTTPYIGKRYRQGDFKVPFTMPNTRKYKVDYWYLLAGKWNYAVKPYTNNMTLTDGDAIDEVRVYPADAVMTTYTYDPPVGVTSESDLNGRVIFYEYDPLGRLSIVRDQYKNILKRICYNYAGQPENCGGTSYGNAAITQVFTRQNCGPGYTAGTYSYTVPANKYVTDDQATADALARGDMLSNGQAYVDQNGPCFCLGEDHKEINGRCEKGIKVNFIEPVDGGTRCRKGYYYRFPDGSIGPKYYGAYVVCP